ncbi:MAG: zinc dependent phospholipase C family protein [Acidobacteriia bacterium]|nr:zinc dependent phospholipase C family protein [Terriglobia bacterium]
MLLRFLALAVVSGLLWAPIASGYSVLTHEAIVDSLWDTSIQKLLLKRFPAATPEELKEAHAYVYGGCILQDMGYYPFSSRLFSDLTHYVRSGDFILALIRESQDIHEYAFALGALAHYAADTNGHKIATNLAVPLLYPKLRQKFGKEVTYWDDPRSHIRTEFGFDVLQVAQGRYAPESYHSFIGFQVSKPVLERAFLDTYGVELKDVFGSLDLALGSFRYSVGSIIPGMTRVAWQLKKQQVVKELPGTTRKKFLYSLSRSSYEKEWGTQYHKPGLRTRIVAWVMRIIPKAGPFKSLAFRAPTPEVEKLFMASFNATVASYRTFLESLNAGQLRLANENFDVGEPSAAGKYLGADQAYDHLLDKLAQRKFTGITPELSGNLLDYYKDRKAPPTSTKKAVAEWTKLSDEVEELRSAAASSGTEGP